MAIALVALISVLGNAYMTGNFIRVQKTQVGPAIYTQAEINNLLKNYYRLNLDSNGGSPQATVVVNNELYFVEVIKVVSDPSGNRVAKIQVEKKSTQNIRSDTIRVGFSRVINGINVVLIDAGGDVFTEEDIGNSDSNGSSIGTQPLRFTAHVVVYKSELNLN